MEHNLLTELRISSNRIARVRFKTRSPKPEVAIYTSVEPLPYYENYPYFNWDGPLSEYKVTLYMAEQIQILCYNNPDYNYDDIKGVVLSRILLWKNNDKILDFYKSNPSTIENAMDWYYLGMEHLNPRLDFRKTWYGDDVEALSGKDRIAAKAAARAERNREEFVQDIKASSMTYRFNNFDISPTIKFLDDELALSRTTIKKYGKGYYIGPAENSLMRVKIAQRVYPEKSQGEVAELLELSRATVNKLWKKDLLE